MFKDYWKGEAIFDDIEYIFYLFHLLFNYSF
jgi:hypothetical protein